MNIKLPSPVYLPSGCHAYVYPLATVYAHCQEEADRYYINHVLVK